MISAMTGLVAHLPLLREKETRKIKFHFIEKDEVTFYKL
jgi:hypothetical protein